MQAINNDFLTAKALYDADEFLFLPLIEKFEELKKVLQSNFIMRQKKRKWYGKTFWISKPVLNVEIESKITYDEEKYLFIRINGEGYVMGIGKYGDLKDKLYFCEGNMFPRKNVTVVYTVGGLFGHTEYALEYKITLVQLFSHLIKKYKKFLVQGT